MGETKELTLPVRTLISVGDVSKVGYLGGGGGGEMKGGRSGGYGCIAPATSPCK